MALNTTYLVLLVLVIIYIPMFIIVKKSEKCHRHGIVTAGPLIMIKTRWGIKFMDKVGKYKRFWRVCGFASRIITILLMVYIVTLLIIDVVSISFMGRTAGLGIEYALAIPGLNPMLPIVYGWIALIVAVVVHETAHGIQTRANDMEVSSTGIIHCVVPLGAFVEPNQEQVEKSSRRAKLDLYAAGITTNFVLGIVCFMLLFAGMTGGIATDFGDSPAVSGEVADSPAALAEIPVTSIIISMQFGDEPQFDIKTLDDMNSYIDQEGHFYGVYKLRYIHENETYTATMPIGAYVSSVVKDGPAYIQGFPEKSFLISMTECNSEKKIIGEEYRFGTETSWTDFISKTSPGEIYLTKYVKSGTNDVRELYIKLGDNGTGKGYMGIYSPTTSGLSFVTPNAVLQKSVNPFYGMKSFRDQAFGFLAYLGSAFNGFSPIPEPMQWWFHSTSILPDSVFWVAMKLCYWVFWLNILLGVTNALPAVPFDGGFLFMGGVDYLLEKFGRMKDPEKRERIASSVTRMSSVISISALVLVFIVVIF